MTRARPGSKWSMDGQVQALARVPAGGKLSGMMCACMSTIISVLLSTLLNHLVRPQQDGLSYGEAERLGSLEVDHELKCGGLLDGHLRRVGALQDPVDVPGGESVQFGYVGSIGDQTASSRVFAPRRHDWQPAPRQPLAHAVPIGEEEDGRHQDQRLESLCAGLL